MYWLELKAKIETIALIATFILYAIVIIIFWIDSRRK